MEYSFLSAYWISMFCFHAAAANPFLRPISEKGGKIETNAKGYPELVYTWNFRIPNNNEMIYIALWDSYKGFELKLAGRRVSKLHQNFGGFCYYFATRHTDTREMRSMCKQKAATDPGNCRYLEVDTFYMTYNGSNPPNFKLSYLYTECTDQSQTISTTSTTTPISHRTDELTGISNQVDVRIQSDFNRMNGSSKNTTDLTTPKVEVDDDDEVNVIIIPVILAAVFFALTVLLLLFCGIRMSQQKAEQTELRLQQLQKRSASGSSSNTRKCGTNIVPSIHSITIDNTYAEIGPMLPARNLGVTPQDEHRYETPVQIRYGRNEDVIHSEAAPNSFMIRGDSVKDISYMNESADEFFRQDAAEGEISRQNEGNSYEIGNENCVSHLNSKSTENNISRQNSRKNDFSLQNDVGPYTMMTGSINGSNTVNNVLYNM